MLGNCGTRKMSAQIASVAFARVGEIRDRMSSHLSVRDWMSVLVSVTTEDIATSVMRHREMVVVQMVAA